MLDKIKILLFGLLFGVCIRLFDIYTNILGNIFSSISVFILIGVIIVLKSNTRKNSMINVLIFFLSMLLTYYLTAFITHGVYGKSYIIGWTIVALLSPLFAYFTYFIKSNNKISKIIKLGIILVTILSSYVLFENIYFYDYIVLLILIYLFYFKKNR